MDANALSLPLIFCEWNGKQLESSSGKIREIIKLSFLSSEK